MIINLVLTRMYLHSALVLVLRPRPRRVGITEILTQHQYLPGTHITLTLLRYSITFLLVLYLFLLACGSPDILLSLSTSVVLSLSPGPGGLG